MVPKEFESRANGAPARLVPFSLHAASDSGIGAQEP